MKGVVIEMMSRIGGKFDEWGLPQDTCQVAAPIWERWTTVLRAAGLKQPWRAGVRQQRDWLCWVIAVKSLSVADTGGGSGSGC
jgi:hypothetical protein